MLSHLTCNLCCNSLLERITKQSNGLDLSFLVATTHATKKIICNLTCNLKKSQLEMLLIGTAPASPPRDQGRTLVRRLPPPPPLPHTAAAGESRRAKLTRCRWRGALPCPAAVQIGGGRRALAWQRPASCARGGSHNGSGGARRAGGRAAEQRGGRGEGGRMVLLRISSASWRRRPAAALRWLAARPRTGAIRARSGFVGRGMAQLFRGQRRLLLDLAGGGRRWLLQGEGLVSVVRVVVGVGCILAATTSRCYRGGKAIRRGRATPTPSGKGQGLRDSG
jgi:hypothetical protein